jgi:hypothetical protein
LRSPPPPPPPACRPCDFFLLPRGRALCASLKGHKGITSLDVSNNLISFNGAKALLEMMMKNPSIKALNVTNNYFDQSLGTMLEKVAAANADGLDAKKVVRMSQIYKSRQGKLYRADDGTQADDGDDSDLDEELGIHSHHDDGAPGSPGSGGSTARARSQADFSFEYPVHSVGQLKHPNPGGKFQFESQFRVPLQTYFVMDDKCPGSPQRIPKMKKGTGKPKMKCVGGKDVQDTRPIVTGSGQVRLVV